jgi:hypothetical protein
MVAKCNVDAWDTVVLYFAPPEFLALTELCQVKSSQAAPPHYIYRDGYWSPAPPRPSASPLAS